MGVYPPPLERLIEQFARLPGIGRKSATRLGLHFLSGNRELAEQLAASLLEVKDKIRLCSVCCNITETDPCSICANPHRATGVICVVESPEDQLALEELGVFQGRYHVLHGTLSPLDGRGPDNLKISGLLQRLDTEDIQEIIIATNPTTAGETTASYVADLILKERPAIRMTRIALGIPMGGDLKHTDAMTLQHALNRRSVIERP